MEYKSEASWFAQFYTATLLQGSEMIIQISFQLFSPLLRQEYEDKI